MNLDTLTKSKAFNWTDLLDTPSSITANEFVRGNGAGTDLVQFDLFAASNIWTAENTFNENLFGLSNIYIGGVTQVDLCGTYNFIADAIAQWKCNDNLATTDVVDSVGSFTGTATENTEDLSAAGKINEAFNFDSGNSEFIDLDSTSIIGSGNYTILGWFNASSPDDFQRLYTEGNSGDNLQYTSVGFRQDGHIRFTVVNAGASIGIETSTDYGDGAWHSFMARRSASNDWDLYIDGGTEIVNSTTNVSSPSINQVTLGALRRIATENYWNGDIDNVLIINRAIADSEYLSWHDGESEAINTGEGSVINGIGTTSVICSQKLTDSEKNLLIEGDIEASNAFFNTVSSKEINGSISILLANEPGADFIIGNNNALVVEGDNDRVGIGISAPLVPLHLPDNTAIGFGNTANVTIDYDSILSVGMFDGGNWLMNSTNQFQFGDNGTYIAQLNDGHLDLTADISFDFNTGTVDIPGDNQNLRLGATLTDLQLFSDGIDGNISTTGDLEVACGANKTIELQTVVWDDYVTPITKALFGGSSNDPTLTKIGDDGAGSAGVWALLFSDGDEVLATVQIPHRWKEGTDIIPHIHFMTTTDVAPSDNFGIEFEYWWADIGEDFPANTTLETNDIPTGVNSAKQHQTANTTSSAISGSGHTISSVLNIRIKRVVATGDNYAGGIYIHDFDIHYQVNTMGSRQELIK